MGRRRSCDLGRIDRSPGRAAPRLRAPARRVATDPSFPADGVCVADGCDNEIRMIAALNEDPFCSSKCCRAHYGVVR